MSRRHGHSVVTKTGIGRSDHAQPLSILPLAISTIEKKSPPLTRSYPTCPSAKRPIPSRATSGYYKALEPFGPRSGTFQHLFGQATTVHRVDPLGIDLLDPVHDPAHGLFRCEDARLTVQVAHLFAQIFSYDGRLVAVVAQVDTAKYCQKPCAVSSISISTTSSSRPVRSYAWRCRSAPLPRSRVSRTSAETSSQSSASSKAGRVKASSFSIISRAGTACSDPTSKSFASSPSREASQWAARRSSGRVLGYVSSRSARSWQARTSARERPAVITASSTLLHTSLTLISTVSTFSRSRASQ